MRCLRDWSLDISWPLIGALQAASAVCPVWQASLSVPRRRLFPPASTTTTTTHRLTSLLTAVAAAAAAAALWDAATDEGNDERGVMGEVGRHLADSSLPGFAVTSLSSIPKDICCDMIFLSVTPA